MSTVEKNKVGQRDQKWEGEEVDALSNQSPGKVFRQRPGAKEETSHVATWSGEECSRQRNSKCKGSEA